MILTARKKYTVFNMNSVFLLSCNGELHHMVLNTHLTHICGMKTN